jgi:phospholipid-transporting ATPase
VVLAVGSATGAELYNKMFLKKVFYINEDTTTDNFGLNVLTFFILYSNFIPISLTVTLEGVRFLQALYINNVSTAHY